MKYSQLLSDPLAQSAFKAAFVDDIESPIQDFDIDPSVASDAKSIAEFLNVAIEREIDARKKFKELKPRMDELEEKMRPYRERQEKVRAVTHTVRNYIEGNLQEPYAHLESAVIRDLAGQVVDRFSDQIHLDDGSVIPGDPEPDTSSMSELDAILTRARITRLSSYTRIEDMVFHTFINSGYTKLMR